MGTLVSSPRKSKSKSKLQVLKSKKVQVQENAQLRKSCPQLTLSDSGQQVFSKWEHHLCLQREAVQKRAKVWSFVIHHPPNYEYDDNAETTYIVIIYDGNAETMTMMTMKL